MKTCYVSAPFGVKQVPHPSGQMVEADFDRIYHEVIVPTVSEAGLICVRGDELESRGVISKSVFTSVIGSEVMIADISNNSPDVLYELGARHALRREVTIIIKATGGPIPHHMNYNRLCMYDLDRQGRMDEESAARFKAMLISVIRSSVERVTNDSPIYELFPELRVELPDELCEERESVKNYPRLTKRAAGARRPAAATTTTAAAANEEEARASEQAVRETENVDPHAHIEVLKKYRAASNWNEVVRYADELPEEVKRAPEVVQLVALALNRRNEPGDQERAIAMLKQFIAETGGDGDSYGIVARIYKDRFLKHRQAGETDEAEADFDEAFRHYREGFERQPSNFYLGHGLVLLLLQYGGAEPRRGAVRDELSAILPRVRQAVRDVSQGKLVGYWELETAMELACVAGDWEEARALLQQVLDKEPPPWMIDTATQTLELIGRLLDDPAAPEQVAEIVCRLRESQSCEEGRNA